MFINSIRKTKYDIYVREKIMKSSKNAFVIPEAVTLK